MTAATPLRSTELPPPPSVDASTDPYAAHLLDLIERVDDLSSWSDELAVAGAAWPDSYHLHPSRANVLRALSISSDARVLELGARAGGLTRYLGERSALVDALELDPALATVAAARCRDLDGVQVSVGWLDVVPERSAYDLVVAVDVMSELADHDMTLTDFVARCRSILTPDGVLVMAADNGESLSAALGGRHRPVPVPGGGPAVVRADDVESAVTAAAMQSMTLSAFPDHRHAQIMFSHPQLAEIGDGLLADLPKFDAPPTGSTHADPAAQQRLWTAMVADGTADGRANSFVVLASVAAPTLDDVATFWSIGRSAANSARNRVRYEAGRPVIVRERAHPEAETHAPLRLRPHTEPVVEGISISDLLRRDVTLLRAHEILSQWVRLVRSHPEGAVPWDLIPRNVLVRPDDSMEAIDQEWELDGATTDGVLARGWFWLANELVSSPRRPSWLTPGSVGRVAQHLRQISGVEQDPFWLETFYSQEADQSAYTFPICPPNSHASQSHKNRGDLMALSQSGDSRNASPDVAPPADPESVTVLHSMIASLGDENDTLRAHIRSLELQQRRAALVHRDHAMGLVAEAELVRDHLARVQRESRRHKERTVTLQKQIAAIKSSTTWRIGRLLIRPFAAITGKGR